MFSFIKTPFWHYKSFIYPLLDQVYVEGLVYTDGSKNDSDSHAWHVHNEIPGKDFFNWTGRCLSAGGHFNPYRISKEDGWVEVTLGSLLVWAPGSWSMFGPSLIAPALILRRRRGAKALPILGSNRRKLEGSRHGRCHYGSSDMHQCRLQVTFQPTVVTHLANEHLSPTLLASRSTCIFVIDQPLDSFWAASSRELHLAMDWWLTQCGRQLKYASLPLFLLQQWQQWCPLIADLLIHSCICSLAQPAPVHHCANEWGRAGSGGGFAFHIFCPFGGNAMKAANLIVWCAGMVGLPLGSDHWRYIGGGYYCEGRTGTTRKSGGAEICGGWCLCPSNGDLWHVLHSLCSTLCQTPHRMVATCGQVLLWIVFSDISTHIGSIYNDSGQLASGLVPASTWPETTRQIFVWCGKIGRQEVTQAPYQSAPLAKRQNKNDPCDAASPSPGHLWRVPPSFNLHPSSPLMYLNQHMLNQDDSTWFSTSTMQKPFFK